MKFFGDIYRPDAKVGRFLSVLALSGTAYGLYRGVQDNYLAEIVHITAFLRMIAHNPTFDTSRSWEYRGRNKRERKKSRSE
jgi:hypothetical protein